MPKKLWCLILTVLLCGALPHAHAGVGTAHVLAVEGDADYALPGSDEFQPLEEDQELPTGSRIRTLPDSAVLLTGLDGTALKVEENSILVIKEMVTEDGKTLPAVQHTTIKLYSGRLSYIFNDFGNNTESSFKIKAAYGVAAARGGSGFVESNGNIGVVSGDLTLQSDAARVSLQAGECASVYSNGLLRQRFRLQDKVWGFKGHESVLHLAGLAARRRALANRELELVQMRGRAMGLNEEQMLRMIDRPLRPHRRKIAHHRLLNLEDRLELERWRRMHRHEFAE